MTGRTPVATGTRPDTARRPGPAAATLVVAGVSFALLPPLFPHASAEPGLVGAAATATTAWTVSHLFGMLALITLPLGVYGIRGLLGDVAGPAVVATTAGCALALPYYGGETFGAAAVAELAVATGDESLLVGVDAIRWAVLPASFLVGGMLALAAAGVLIAVGVRRGGAVPSWAGVPLAVGLVLFVPQFFAPPAVRVAHGLLLAVGCVLLATAALRVRRY